MWPGAMQLARMPSRPWYALVSRVSMCSAPLAMPYGVSRQPPATMPAVEEMLTMEPPPVSAMRGMACLLENTAPLRLMSRHLR